MAPTACKRTVSGSISPSYSEYFSPFPHGTRSLSVSQEYLALPDGAGSFKRDSSGPALLRIPAQSTNFPYGILTLYDRPSHAVPVTCLLFMQVLQPRTCRNMNGLGSSAFARHYSRNHYYFLLLWVLRCFSSPRSLPFRDPR